GGGPDRTPAAVTPERCSWTSPNAWHNYDDVRGEEFFSQTRRERRAYPSGVCEERATKSGRKRTAARRVAPNLACGGVARRSQIHFGICSLLAPGHRPNSAQRTSSDLRSCP